VAVTALAWRQRLLPVAQDSDPGDLDISRLAAPDLSDDLETQVELTPRFRL